MVQYFYLESRKMSNEQKEEGEQTGCPGRVGGRRFPHGMIHCPFKKLNSLSTQQLAWTGMIISKHTAVSTERDDGGRQHAVHAGPVSCSWTVCRSTHTLQHTQRVRACFGVLVRTREFP